MASEKPRKLRLVTGTPAEVEEAVNALLDDYSPITWSFGFTEAGAQVTCLLILESELARLQRQQMLMAAPVRRPGV